MMMAENIEEEIYFSQDSVFLNTSSVTNCETADGDLVNGQLKVFKNLRDDILIEWEPKEQTVASDSTSDWTLVDTVEYNNGNGKVKIESHSILHMSFPLRDLLKFKVIPCRDHRHRIMELTHGGGSAVEKVVFFLQDGTCHPPLYFYEGGADLFIRTLNAYSRIVRSASERMTYLVNNYSTGPSNIHAPMSLLNIAGNVAYTSQHTFSKILNRPVSAALTGFSKVANYLVDTVISPHPTDRPPYEITEDLVPNRYNISNILLVGQEYELISDIRLPDLVPVERGDPVTSHIWRMYEQEDGRIERSDELLTRICRGGLSDEMRPIVWKYLLGVYQFHDTKEEKCNKDSALKDNYYRTKAQWKSMTPEQERRFSLFRACKELAEKDVKRTDRTLDFYAGDGNSNVDKLYDILLTYVMYNFNLGYVQGMSDMLSPILRLMPDEVEAFWCFSGLMEKMGNNFEESQETMLESLKNLHYLLRFYDGDFCDYLESVNASNMFICFRWLLISFKREFAAEDHLIIWEVLWTSKPCKNFDLIICLAMLEHGKELIMQNKWSAEKVLKYCNNIQGQFDAPHILTIAGGIYNQLAEYSRSQPLHSSSIPTKIRDLFDLPISQRSSVDVDSCTDTTLTSLTESTQ